MDDRHTERELLSRQSSAGRKGVEPGGKQRCAKGTSLCGHHSGKLPTRGVCIRRGPYHRFATDTEGWGFSKDPNLPRTLSWCQRSASPQGPLPWTTLEYLFMPGSCAWEYVLYYMAVKTVGALLVSPSIVLHLSWAGWPVSSKDPSVSATPVLALQLHATFKTSWCWGSNRSSCENSKRFTDGAISPAFVHLSMYYFIWDSISLCNSG